MTTNALPENNVKAIDLRLYLILDAALCQNPQQLLDTARIAAQNGVGTIQLRAPHWHKRQYFASACALKAALAGSAVTLIINDHVDVALAADADGVHLGQHDLPAAAARQLLGADKIIGLSANTVAALDAVPDCVDYLGIGPIYPTTTKTDTAAALGVDGFAQLAVRAPCPAVAIGGLNADNCAPLFSAGAHGIAVAAAICSQPEIAHATRRLHAISHRPR